MTNEDAARRPGRRIGASSRLLRPTLPSPDRPTPGSQVRSCAPNDGLIDAPRMPALGPPGGCRGLRRSATPRRPPKRGLRRLRLRAELRALAHSAGADGSHERSLPTRSPRTSQPFSSWSAAARTAPHVLLRTRVPKSQRRSRAQSRAGSRRTTTQSAAALLPGFRRIVHTVTFAHCVHQQAQCPSWAATQRVVAISAQDGRPEPPKPGNVCAEAGVHPRLDAHRKFC
jgi:hypothetical protein